MTENKQHAHCIQTKQLWPKPVLVKRIAVLEQTQLAANCSCLLVCRCILTVNLGFLLWRRKNFLWWRNKSKQTEPNNVSACVNFWRVNAGFESYAKASRGWHLMTREYKNDFLKENKFYTISKPPKSLRKLISFLKTLKMGIRLQ